MDIREKLTKFKKWELENLARQLEITGFSQLNKQALIEHIIANCTEPEIKAIIEVKSTWWLFSWPGTFFLFPPTTAAMVIVMSVVGGVL